MVENRGVSKLAVMMSGLEIDPRYLTHEEYVDQVSSYADAVYDEMRDRMAQQLDSIADRVEAAGQLGVALEIDRVADLLDGTAE